MTRPIRLPLAAIVFLALSAPAASAQSSFSVDPLIFNLNTQANNAVLTITNPTGKDLSFELKAFAWEQAPTTGAMQLTPTSDIVIFPPLVTVKARTTQRVRIGTTLAQGPVEKAYRILIEELPSASAAPAANQVNVRTRIGVPVFIEPTKPALSGRIDSVTIGAKGVAITVSNTGNTHAMVDTIVIRGMAGPDQVAFEDSLPGWYVLAGKTRVWEYRLKIAQCKVAKFVEVEVHAHDKVLTSRADITAASCGP